MRKNLIKICVINILILSLTIANNRYIIMDIGKDPYRSSGSLINSNEIDSLENIKKVGFIEVNKEEKIERVYFYDNDKYKIIEEFREGDSININKFKEFNQRSLDEYNKFILEYGELGIPYLGPEIYDESKSELLNFIEFLYKNPIRFVILKEEEYIKYL